MNVRLSKTHRSTCKALFQHPVPRDLHWREVQSMLAAMAEVVKEPNGDLKITRGKETLVLRPLRDKDVVEMQQLMEIRRFLERSSPAAPPRAHLLVVIDHREARIYRADLHGSVPQRITPYDPHGFGRYLHDVQAEADGRRKPERKTFYEAVAKTLKGASMILVFGSGTGASSAMNQLLAELERHHKDIAERIAGRVVVDEQHLTEDQLLAKARDFYVSSAPERTTHAHHETKRSTRAPSNWSGFPGALEH